MDFILSWMQVYHETDNVSSPHVERESDCSMMTLLCHELFLRNVCGWGCTLSLWHVEKLHANNHPSFNRQKNPSERQRGRNEEREREREGTITSCLPVFQGRDSLWKWTKCFTIISLILMTGEKRLTCLTSLLPFMKIQACSMLLSAYKCLLAAVAATVLRLIMG